MLMAMAAFHIALLAGAAGLLVAAAVNDFFHYRIPNKICAGILVSFPLFVLTSPHSIDWKQNILIFVLILAAGFVMFLGHLAGAGDIKLLAVTGLWAGAHHLGTFLIGTALAGGVVAGAMAVATYLRNRSATERNQPPVAISKVPIPYGMAIAAGGLNVLFRLAQPILFPG
jgi:prepilin peptidase CpaA